MRSGNRVRGAVFLLALCLGFSGARAQGGLEGTFAAGGLTASLELKGNEVSGRFRIDGADRPVNGRVSEQRITGSFEYQGSRIPFDAALDGEVLVVNSGGVSHRLLRQVVQGNPLARKDLTAAGAPGTAGEQLPSGTPAADDGAALAQKFPHVLSLSSGTSMRYPAGWKVEKGSVTTLTPPNQILSLTNFMVWTLPLPVGEKFGPQTVDALTKTVSRLYPGLEHEGEPQALGVDFSEGMQLRYRAKSLLGIPFRLELLARPRGKTLLLMVGSGDDETLASSLPTAKEMLRTFAAAGDGAPPARNSERTPPASADLDPALVGTWRSTQTHADANASASFAVERVFTFGADGTFTRSSRAIGGTADVSADTGSKENARGQWRASGGTLTTTDQKGERFEVGYTFHEGQLVFNLGKGKYTFWSR